MPPISITSRLRLFLLIPLVLTLFRCSTNREAARPRPASVWGGKALPGVQDSTHRATDEDGLRRHVASLQHVEWLFDEGDTWHRDESTAPDGYLVLTYKNRHIPDQSFVARAREGIVDRLVTIGTTRRSKVDQTNIAAMLAIASRLAWGEEHASDHITEVVALGDKAIASPGSAQAATVGGLQLSAGAIHAADGIAFMLDFTGSAHNVVEAKVPLEAPRTEILYVSASALNLRDKPKTGQVIQQLQKGEKVTVSARDGNWVEVHTLDSVTGWVHADYLSADKPLSLQGIFEKRQKDWNDRYEEAKNSIVKKQVFDELNRWSYNFARANAVVDWKGKLSFYAGGSSASVDVVSQEYGIQVNYKGEVKASEPAYKQLAAMEDDLPALFSGSFVTKDDVIEEESWTSWGRMDNPAFRFRFTEFKVDTR